MYENNIKFRSPKYTSSQRFKSYSHPAGQHAFEYFQLLRFYFLNPESLYGFIVCQLAQHRHNTHLFNRDFIINGFKLPQLRNYQYNKVSIPVSYALHIVHIERDCYNNVFFNFIKLCRTETSFASVDAVLKPDGDGDGRSTMHRHRVAISSYHTSHHSLATRSTCTTTSSLSLSTHHSLVTLQKY